VSVDLPSFRQAADELVARAARGSREFQGNKGPRLSMLVNQVWIDRFAWDGRALLLADIVFGECDDKLLVEQLAKFLWTYKAELQKI
jgi:hypothetical protein